MTDLHDAQTRLLPPGLSEDEFSRALEAFAGAVGAEHVLTGDEQLVEFRDPFAFATWDEYTASAVVMPETVEEIQAIVRIANRIEVPLWTHSGARTTATAAPRRASRAR